MLRLVCLVTLASIPLAHADDNPAMALMAMNMRCPAISADGKHVAIYSLDPGTDKDAKTSLAVFDAGVVADRMSIVPPAIDVARAKAAAAKLTKLLDDGGYKRMSRVARVSGGSDKLTYKAQLKSEDAV